jgi:hypothetical protein
MLDMTGKIDVYVRNPGCGITKSLRHAFVQFERLDDQTKEPTGTTSTLGMTTEDAMRLLRHLQHLKDRFGLSIPDDGPIVDATPTKPN